MYASFLNDLFSILDSSAICRHANMAHYTSFKAGGHADILLFISDEQQLQTSLALLNSYHFPYMIIGNGTNLLVKDTGYPGILIRFSNENIAPAINDTIIEAHAGTSLSTLSQSAASAGLGGLEFLSGIPGTVGGAIYMNAGAYGGEIKDVLSHVQVLQSNGSKTTLTAENLGFSYRTSLFQSNSDIILRAAFQTTPASPASIYNKMNSFNAMRREKQPLEYPSAGSTFKRPPGHYAGQLIEQCGLKGRGVGGARVSEKHAGFIINYNRATAQDILDTIDMVSQAVLKTFGIQLEPEVQILG